MLGNQYRDRSVETNFGSAYVSRLAPGFRLNLEYFRDEIMYITTHTETIDGHPRIVPFVNLRKLLLKSD